MPLKFGRRPLKAAGKGCNGFTLVAFLLPATGVLIGCGPPRSDINDAFNMRDTGHYEVVSRQADTDGTVTLLVRAEKPEHSRTIADELVVQNFAFSPKALRIVVDSAASGARLVYRWDTKGLRDATSQDAPGLPTPAATGASVTH